MSSLHNSSEQGAILIEAVLAVMIMSVGIVYVLQSYLASYRASVYNAEYTKAVLMADNLLAKAASDNFVYDAQDYRGKFDRPFDDYRYEFESNDRYGVRELVLNVFWKRGMKERKLSMTTLLLDTEIAREQ